MIYGTYVSNLSVQFFTLPAMILTGHKPAEDIMRRTGLAAMCVSIVADLAWANAHPRPLPLWASSAAAAVSAAIQLCHLLLALGVMGPGVPYSWGAAAALQLSQLLPWILVTQVSTAFVVSSGRSPARYQILAWITVMALGTAMTLLPQLRERPVVVVAMAVAPRATVAAALAWSSWADAAVGSEPSRDQDEAPPVAVPRACRFAAFACVGSTGEALNDMATDLTIRGALSAGNTSLTLSYNCAVVLSMCGGYMSERAASGPGARRAFASLWGLCQLCRGLGMQHLTPERTWLMFAFVFFDKFTGPLGQAAIDTALLALLRRDSGGAGPAGWPRMPANAVWTLRTAAERLERPLCQLLLLQLGIPRAPAALPVSAAGISVAFVWHTLRTGDRREDGGKED